MGFDLLEAFDLLEVTDVLWMFFDLIVGLSFGYLYFMFRSKFKATEEKLYKYLSLGFAFTFLSSLLSMLTMFINTDTLSDVVIDQIDLFDDVTYCLTTALSTLFFILAAKSLKLKSSTQ